MAKVPLKYSDHIVYVAGEPYMLIDSNGLYSPIDCPTCAGETIVIDWKTGIEIARAKDPYNTIKVYDKPNNNVYVVTKVDSMSSFHCYSYVDNDKKNIHVWFDVQGGWKIDNANTSVYPIIKLCHTKL